METELGQGIDPGVEGEIRLWAEIWVPSLMGFGWVVLKSTALSLDARVQLAVDTQDLGLKPSRHTLMHICLTYWRDRYHRSG